VGFFLNDNSVNYLKNDVITNLKPHIVNFDIITDTSVPSDLDDTIKLFLSEDYNSIYKKLITKFFSDKIYDQEFRSTLSGTAMSKIGGMHDYHISFAALIFINFLIELEISTLISKVIKINTEKNPRNNNLENLYWNYIYDYEHTKTRIYRSSINNNIMDKIDKLCTTLDTLFYKFMDEFIKQLHTLNQNIRLIDVYNCFIPFYHYDHYNDDGTLQKNFFDFIYVDWKEKIRKLFRKTIPNWDKGPNTQTNNILEITIKLISNNNQKYIADAIGFFSFIYMLNPKISNSYFGSCITFSSFEFYIMSRLHVKADRLNLVIEVPDSAIPHKYWKLTQQFSGQNILSHWATKFTFRSKTIHLRNVYEFNEASIINFATPVNKRKILQLLTYPIFDNYFEYLKQNDDKFMPDQKIKIKQIKDFINKKAILIESILLTNTDVYTSEDIINNIERFWKDSFKSNWNEVNIEYINLILNSKKLLKKLNLNDSFIKIFDETKNFNGYTILYYYSRFGNLNIVKNIITNLTRVNLNVCNSDNSTPLHGATWGEKDNSNDQMKNRFEIVKLLLGKNADRTLKNTKKEIPVQNNEVTKHTTSDIKKLINSVLIKI
jgi:hypothetical protein